MTGNRKRIIYLISGLSAGLIAFSVIRLLEAAGFSSYLGLSIAQGAALGFIFGFIFGFTDGLLYKELKNGVIKASIAAATGAVTAAAARIIATQGMLWTANILKPEYIQTTQIWLPIWRGAGWMLMGAAIGAVDGIHKRSLRRTIAGILGGLIGGLIGGLGFEFLVSSQSETVFAGAAGLGCMGILIGLSISEFERRFSYAQLRVLNGKLKNREYLLVKRKLRIGGHLQDDICLHDSGDTSSALISAKNNDIYLGAADNSRVLINDLAITENQILKFQDVIQLGDVKLLYLPL